MSKCCITCTASLSPSTTPTETPSASPTEIFSATPTETPSVSQTPSAIPSVLPTESRCVLTGTITFPTLNDTDTFKGYHSESLLVTNENWDTICGYDEQMSDLDCVHEGYAEIGVFPDEQDYYNFHTNESATINNAAGKYAFILQHRFHEWEKDYNETDHEMVGELTLSNNSVAFGTYSHSTGEADTHIGGFINAAYQDILIVDVECDNDCACKSVERTIEMTSICPIRAEIRYPPIIDDAIITEFDYHNNHLSVTQEGLQDNCSTLSSLTQWCQHEGSALSNGDEKEEVTWASIIIRDGRGSYRFKAKDYIYEDETDNEKHTTQLHLWINGMEETTYNHTIDGIYYDTFDVNVECDDNCTCTSYQEIE